LSFESGLAGHANAVQQRLRIYTYIHHINVYGSDEEGSPEEHHRAVSAVSLDADTCSIQIARQSPDIDVLARHSAAFPLFGPSSVRNRFVFGMESVGNRWGIAVEWKAMEWRARRAAFMLSLIFTTKLAVGVQFELPDNKHIYLYCHAARPQCELS